MTKGITMFKLFILWKFNIKPEFLFNFGEIKLYQTVKKYLKNIANKKIMVGHF